MSITKISSLYIYPVKSTAGIRLPHANVEEMGLAFDRRFVVSEPSGQFITARTQPKLCLVQSTLVEQGLALSAPNMPTLTLSHKTFSNKYQNVIVWGDEISGQLCSSQADAWFSEYLQRPCQLLFFGQNSHRERKANTDKARKVAFADGYPLLLISQASLNDLNERLMSNNYHTVSMAQFRPNIVIENTLPFAEDGWQHIRIGEVEFKVSKPCERCIFTTVDPKSAEKHPEQQPLRTLKSFRQTSKGEVLFGQNLIPLNEGQIKQGDPVFVISKQKPPVFNVLKQNSTTLIETQTSKEVSQGQKMQLTCQQIIIETHDVKTFVFTWSGTQKIKQLAGQHINLLINIFGKEQPCCYTIASCPTTKNQISLTIKRVPNGKVSNFFHDHFSVGDTVKARAPSGNFHLPKTIPKKVLLLSAGSGITPMLSMLRFMAEQQTKNQQSSDKITFLHSAHSESDIIASDEVYALAKQHGNCQVIYTLTKQTSPQWLGYKGRLSAQMLTNINDLIHYDIYVCGPEGFRETVQLHLRQLGLNREQYHYESFGSKKTNIATQKNDNSKKEEPKSAVKTVNKKLSIYFDKWHKNHQVNSQNKEQTTILEHGEEAGLILPYSCRAGMCGNCKAKLVSGEVELSSSDGLTAQEKQAGYILCCSAIATTNVVIKHE